MSSVEKSKVDGLQHVAILIPAWQPDLGLVRLLEDLVTRGFGAILVLDDGSDIASAPVFEAVAKIPTVRMLHHAVNLGKGRALKTGINYFLTELPECSVLVSADADGQHRPDDIVRVAKAASPGGRQVALGARTFAADVPLRSKFGNGLTRRIFSFVTGTKLADTQTGLRAFPRDLLPELMTLTGERYEYEMTVLAHICRSGPKPLEVPIETVYIDNNRSSHFDPIRDSMRIYFVLVRFYFSAIVAAGIDFAGFSIAYAATGNLWLAVAVGRLSSLVNFALNKKFVFQNHSSVKGTLTRYYALAVAIAGLSYGLIWALHQRLHWNVFVAKVVVDGGLSLVSFSVQRTFVFRKVEE